MKYLMMSVTLGSLALAACGAPLAYDPFAYTPGELLTRTSNVPERISPDGHFWISQAGGTDDAAIVATNLTVSGLMASSGYCFTNGGAGKGNRFVLNTNLTTGTVYASYAMRIDSLGASYTAANPSLITSICFSNTLGTLIQYCCLMVNTNGVDKTSFYLGVRQASGQAFDTYAPTLYSVGQTLFIVQGYTFVGGEGNDVCDIWINPDPSTFEAASPPAPTVTAFAPAGLTDAFWIDRINFRQASLAGIPEAMTFDELRLGMNWADVTPLPPPQLKIALAAPNAVLSWSTNAGGFVLQDNPNLASASWSAVTNAIVVDGTNNTITVEMDPAARFFRLQK